MDNKGKSKQPFDQNNYPIPVLGIGSTETIDGTSASLATEEAIDDTNIRVVRIAAIGDIWLKFGEIPVAAEDEGVYMPDGGVEYFAVYPKSKIAAINGKANITVTK